MANQDGIGRRICAFMLIPQLTLQQHAHQRFMLYFCRAFLSCVAVMQYFGADSQDCGGPFCERMVMSLEGNIYGVGPVYSYWGETVTSDGTTCDDLVGEFRRGKSQGNRKQDGDAKAPSAASGAPKPAVTKPAAASIASDVSAQHYHDEGHYENRAVYGGSAYVINGIVDAMAGPRREKWDSGVFEFVLSFVQNRVTVGDNTVLAPAITTALDSNTPWVRDKAYKFTFYRHNSY